MQQEFYTRLGQKLKACRKSKGMTLSELSSKIHRSIATLSKYENGDVAFSIDALVDICTALNVDIAECLPTTYKDPDDLNMMKYEKYFVDKLYVYWYNGELKKIRCAVIENTNPSAKSVLYFLADDVQNPHVDFTYHGRVSYSDTSVTFYYTNQEPPFDKMFIRMPLLFPKDHYQTGIMSAITYYYQGVTTKIMASKKAIPMNDALRDELLIDADEIKDLKRSNMLIIR